MEASLLTVISTSDGFMATPLVPLIRPRMYSEGCMYESAYSHKICSELKWEVAG